MKKNIISFLIHPLSLAGIMAVVLLLRFAPDPTGAWLENRIPPFISSALIWIFSIVSFNVVLFFVIAFFRAGSQEAWWEKDEQEEQEEQWFDVLIHYWLKSAVYCLPLFLAGCAVFLALVPEPGSYFYLLPLIALGYLLNRMVPWIARWISSSRAGLR
ncbi:MAG TPA: hypothetical protein VFZ78_10155 [Flavisolibacter sp.]